MRLKHLPTLILSCLCFAACSDQKRKQELDKREQALMNKEIEFASKAADYQALLQMRDSLLTKKTDTAIVQKWPTGIPGNWNGKTVCNESDCGDYVVGDQRSDVWVFAGDSTNIFTKIINNGKLLRVYTAIADSTQIRLHYKTDSTATRKVDIKVVLNPSGNNVMKGTQTIAVNNKCTASFSVELVRTSKP